MAKNKKFEIKKKGYDTFAVDSYVEKIENKLQFSNAKLDVYQKQLEFLSEQIDLKQQQSLMLFNKIQTMEENMDKMIFADEIENYINDEDKQIAQKTADDIILEALLIAKEILDNVSTTALNTKEYKDELLAHLNYITKEVSNIEVIQPLISKIFKNKDDDQAN